MEKYTVKDLYSDVLKEAVFVPEKIRPYVLQRLCELGRDPDNKWTDQDVEEFLDEAIGIEMDKEKERGLDVAGRAKVILIIIKENVGAIIRLLHDKA